MPASALRIVCSDVVLSTCGSATAIEVEARSTREIFLMYIFAVLFRFSDSRM